LIIYNELHSVFEIKCELDYRDVKDFLLSIKASGRYRNRTVEHNHVPEFYSRTNRPAQMGSGCVVIGTAISI
jgi:hypothetical protein